jgi:hypothetical protein
MVLACDGVNVKLKGEFMAFIAMISSFPSICYRPAAGVYNPRAASVCCRARGHICQFYVCVCVCVCVCVHTVQKLHNNLGG